jgi:nicotinate-nucleotide adenylyltransferase
MKIGIMGGSFDPPHKGHLKIARDAERKLGLDLVLFIPCNSHTLKGRLPESSPFHRSNMLALATAWKGNWLVETVEIERGGISYTVETLEFLHKKYAKAQLYFLMGEDSYKDFHLWKEPERIKKLARLVIFPRDSCRIKNVEADEIFMDTAKIDISSKMVRQLLASGKNPSGLLLKVVLEYIQKHSLYMMKKEV